jgi:hypothetical protein
MYNSYYHTVQYNMQYVMQYDVTCVRYKLLAREA